MSLVQRKGRSSAIGSKQIERNVETNRSWGHFADAEWI
jgi:hypothetical protein